MQELSALVLGSVRDCAGACPPVSEEALGAFLRAFNAGVLASCAGGAPHAPAPLEVRRLLSAFMWTTECCSPAVHVSDAYNATHLCGLLVCKHFLLHARAHDARFAEHSLPSLFPGRAELHVAQGPLQSMRYDALAQVLAALQHEWARLDGDAGALACVVACMARFGCFLLFHQGADQLDDEDKREPVAEHAARFRPTKRCARAVVNTGLCLLRAAALAAAARPVAIRLPDAAQLRAAVYGALFHDARRSCAALAPAVRAGALRVKRISAAILGSMDSSDIDDIDVLWAHLVKHLGAPRIGVCPRRKDAALRAFLHDVVVFVAQQARPAAELSVCPAGLRVLQDALRYFYVVPSADKFRHLALLETVSPGHRLNYAHDYCHFDTGQLSQVVYLHNPLFRQGAPPASIADWRRDSCAGPLAAFCQLLPGLEVWYEDCEDPLGVLGQHRHTTRPADHEAGARAARAPPGAARWVLVVARARVLLVDRASAEVHCVPAPPADLEQHHVLGVLMLYLHKTAQLATLATVAINGYKIQFGRTSDVLVHG